MGIEHDIRQTRWESPQQKAVINILYTAGWLEGRSARHLKAFALTPQQFNILRILRGRKGEPATVKLLTERMLDKASNASRLVEKLLDKGLVDRCQHAEDRRAVEVRITEAGLELLGRIDATAEAMHAEAYRLTDAEAELLSGLLDRMRHSPESSGV